MFLENNDVEYLDDNNLETNLEFDRSFNTSLASVDPDYLERAIPLVANRIVEVYLVSGLDLAISKLARLSDRDIEDIKELYLNGKFSLEAFKNQRIMLKCTMRLLNNYTRIFNISCQSFRS